MQPGVREEDGAILDAVWRTFLNEPVFRDYAIERGAAGQASDERRVTITVADATVRMTGKVESLSHRRLAEALAWWYPGVMDVDNRLRVTPPERDTDEELTDALCLVLEKDPSVDATQVHVSVKDRIVTLEGLVHTDEGRRRVEFDVWSIPGVHDVVNRIAVQC